MATRNRQIIIDRLTNDGIRFIKIEQTSCRRIGVYNYFIKLNQDGFASGRLSNIDVDSTGVIFARFTNGRSNPLGQVALSNFANPQGLRQLGNTSWGETFTSGDAVRGSPGTGSLGLVQSGALESSNVDLTQQLVNMITAQRNFQANAQMISTADQVTQTIINIR